MVEGNVGLLKILEKCDMIKTYSLKFCIDLLEIVADG